MHFETIWNEAESLAKSYTDLKRKDILQKLREAMNNLADSDEQPEYHEALGDVLFELCSLCAHLEEVKEIEVNSATALIDATERRRAELLDPEPE